MLKRFYDPPIFFPISFRILFKIWIPACMTFHAPTQIDIENICMKGRVRESKRSNWRSRDFILRSIVIKVEILPSGPKLYCFNFPLQSFKWTWRKRVEGSSGDDILSIIFIVSYSSFHISWRQFFPFFVYVLCDNISKKTNY